MSNHAAETLSADERIEIETIRDLNPDIKERKERVDLQEERETTPFERVVDKSKFEQIEILEN